MRRSQVAKRPPIANEQRREQAKLKLEQELLEQREARGRRRRIWITVGLSVLVVMLVLVGIDIITKNSDSTSTTPTTSATTTAATTATTAGMAGVPPLPPFTPAADLGANCQYPPSSEQPSRQVNPPRQGKVPTEPAQVSVSVVTNQGMVGLLLANNESPCTVNNFASLSQQKFFDNTQCHRLTASPTSSILQCGDPSGDGTGGPGYQFPNEYPTDQYAPDDSALHEPVIYPRGTLAMANSGPNTNGSQFFMVYRDTPLPPEYTVFGTIQQDGLATLDKIAKGGVAGGEADGRPATEVTILSIRLD